MIKLTPNVPLVHGLKQMIISITQRHQMILFYLYVL